MKKLLVINCAALSWDLCQKHGETVGGLSFQKMAPEFPALTGPAQAAFRTASPMAQHGLVANGRYLKELKRILFWEQSAALVSGPRIWDKFRAQGGRVGMMFWQQSLGESVDLVLSPKPVHKHSGGLLQDCLHKPEGLLEVLEKKIGRPFSLFNYWGPLANHKSSDWIIEATSTLLETPAFAPELLLTYIPHLDYDLQRFGPNHPKTKIAFDYLHRQLETLVNQAKAQGYEILIFGDYAIAPVTQKALFPNRMLREQGWLKIQRVKGKAYPDLYHSDAFAMVDHEIAHVYGPKAHEAATAFENSAIEVLDEAAQKEQGLYHENNGSLLLRAPEGSWFAYPWWEESREAPDFASHVDIHNKPGYDPCELFFGWPPGAVSQNTDKVKGSHGKGGYTAFASSCNFNAKSLIELAQEVKQWLTE